jgi:chloride channel 7
LLPEHAAKKDECLDIRAIDSRAWSNLPRNKKTEVKSWLVFFMLGVGMGLIAWLMAGLEEPIVEYRWDWSQDLIDIDELFLSYLAFTAISCLLVTISASMTIWWGPGAAGSGVAETMAFTNGMNYHGFLGLETLVTKIIGVVLAVAGGMRVGKEGPLAHIGSIVGVGAAYVPLGFNSHMRNDRDKRVLVAAGAGVGVSVAFGSPIGGVLFAYEISRADAFWMFADTWKTFFATSTANFTLAMLVAIQKWDFKNLTNAGLIKFGKFSSDSFSIGDLFAFVWIGVWGGIIGAGFIALNRRASIVRKRFVTSNLRKLVDCLLICVIGCTISFFLPMGFGCVTDTKHEVMSSGVKYMCEGKDDLNPMASLLFKGEGETVKILLSNGKDVEFWVHFVFLVYWFAMTATTYGCSIPAGLFIPGILMGNSLGLLIGSLFKEMGYFSDGATYNS